MVFAHGFGCDQNMWRLVEPTFRSKFKTVLFDHVGAGGSDLSAYSKEKYASLEGYADDVIEICRALNLKDAIFVGHSVSGMIGTIASTKAPRLFSKLVLVGPSPRYINDHDYIGGFSAAQIEELLELRWMIEELRVSYFAQALGTPYSVSDKRIFRAMDELTA